MHMKRKSFFYILLVFIILLHFLALHLLGISGFSTTIVFYCLLYIFLKRCLLLIKKEELRNIFVKNLKSVVCIFLIFELGCGIFFPRLNSYTEQKTSIYLSEFMREKQVRFLTKMHLLKHYQHFPTCGYTPHSSIRQQTMDFNFNTKYNEAGLRGKMPHIAKDSGEYRIVVIGDSFAEGYGAGEDSTFPVQLESILNRHSLVTVINGGICGSNPVYETQLYHRLLKPYTPDLVILEVNDGDLKDYEKVVKQGRMPVREYFYAISHLFRIVTRMAEDFNENGNHLPAQEMLEYINGMESLLDNFNRELQATHQKFLVLYIPFRQNVFENNNDRFHDLLLKKLAENKIPNLDMKDYYRISLSTRRDSLLSYYWPNDGHNNSRGYALIAYVTSLKLQELKYIK